MGALGMENTLAAVTSILRKQAESTGNFPLAKDVALNQRRVALTQA
jgi:hypothetical protein